MNNLVISEKFYSIQGEGQTVGTPAVFIRLSGCNILCQSDSWICDSIEVWKKGKKTEFNLVLNEKEISLLRQGCHLIFTGGEPLLHQKSIINYIKWFQERYNFLPIIEFETNGTIIPEDYLQLIVKYWNVSPKLQNSGENWDKRFKPEAINLLKKLKGSIFKFVIEKEEDFEDFSNTYLIMLEQCWEKLYFMPAGENQEKLNITREIVVNLCKEHCIKFTDRTHIVIWNKKTGV